MSEGINVMCALGFHSYSNWGEPFKIKTFSLGNGYLATYEVTVQEKVCKKCNKIKRREIDRVMIGFKS